MTQPQKNAGQDFNAAQKSEDLSRTPRYILVAEDDGGNPHIRLQNLTVRTPGLNGRELVKDVTLTLERGKRYVLTGESGSGKTITAKAILNRHDSGSGMVILPSGMKIMAMSQQAYFPNTTLRSILNMRPEGQEIFSDDELVAALRTVGHEKLIQHIPGQQTGILLDGLIQKLPGGGSTADIRAAMNPIITEMVKEQFSTVQYIPDEQRSAFAAQLWNALPAMDVQDAAALAKGLCDDIDIALAQPLKRRLVMAVPNVIQYWQPRFLPYSPDKAAYFRWGMERSLKSGLRRYLANKDTDDLDRPIRINEKQAAHVIDSVTAAVREECGKHTNDSILSIAFNAASWPLSLLNVRRKARRAAKEMVQNLTFFMDKQVMRGDSLTLSGGERQKLIIAMVLLHKPDLLILDEITAAMDRKTAETLYKEMMDRIPEGTTVLSIAHNEHILQYHTHRAHLENRKIAVNPVPAP